MTRRYGKSKRRSARTIRNESASIRRRRSLRENYPNDITDTLIEWGFENYGDEHYDYFMPLGFYATYNAEDGYCGIIWDRKGFYTYDIELNEIPNYIKTSEDADEFGRLVYNYSEYYLEVLIRYALEKCLKADKVGRDEYEWVNGHGETVYINLSNWDGSVIYEDGDVEGFENLDDLFEAGDIFR